MSDVLWAQLLEAVEYIRNNDVHDAARRIINDLRPQWHSVTEKPPFRIFVPRRGWIPKELPYVLAVDAKGRMSVGYASEHSGYDLGYGWTFAKPIGVPTHWMKLPEPPKLEV